jgi:UDP-3-O-[3-hydroxymyristoyl] glucosamine N-acyltransferase
MGEQVQLTVRKLVEELDPKPLRVLGDLDRAIARPVTLSEKNSQDGIAFCKINTSDALTQIQASSAGTVICHSLEGLEELGASGKTIIVVEKPRLYFIRVVQNFFAPRSPVGIHPSAIIDESARIDPSASIGPMTYIGPHCSVGSGSVIHGRVYIYGNTTIGKNVIIHAGTVIGADGFGYERNAEGEFEKFPHTGGVVIGDEVEIGANTCIDRGTIGNTIIRAGSKIDNLVHIAHNVCVEEDCAVIAHAMLAGSVVVGKGSWVAPNAAVRESVKIGPNSLIGLGAVVVSNVQEGTTVMGAPARESGEYKALLKAMKGLLGKL